MKTVRVTLAVLFRWLPIVAAGALIAWDLSGKHALQHVRANEVLALSARDGRLHALYVRLGPDRAVRDVAIDAEHNTFRLKLADGALSGSLQATPPPLFSPSLGFFHEQFTTTSASTHFRRFVIPEWPIVLALTALASSGAVSHYLRRRRRKLLGLCTRCGHNLRGNRGSCSECGSLAPMSA